MIMNYDRAFGSDNCGSSGFAAWRRSLHARI
jgi:hypothetical protein